MSRPRLMSSSAPLVIALALLAVSERPADAALGIVVPRTRLAPVGDPKAELEFDLNLVSFNELRLGDGIMIEDIPNVTAARYDFIVSNLFTLSTSAGSSSGLFDVTLTFTPTSPLVRITNDTPDDIPIGRLVVETGFEFDPAEYGPLLVPFVYRTQTHLFPSGVLNIGQGLTPVASVVPEPASLALTAFGLVGFGALSRARRSSRSFTRAAGPRG